VDADDIVPHLAKVNEHAGRMASRPARIRFS